MVHEPRVLEERRHLLPLLPYLSVLLAERHVSRAAARVGVTQPTMSRTLAAARTLLGDDLIVRTASGLSLTPRGEALRDYAATSLHELDRFWTPEKLMPATAQGCIRLAATDYVSQTYLPRAVGALRRNASALQLEIMPWSADALGRLERDDIQLGVNPLGAAPNGFYRRRIAVDRYVVVAAARSRKTRGRLDLQRFLEAPHVLTSTEGGERGVVDRVLRRQGKRRNILARVAEFQTAAAIVSTSDLVATLPERVAEGAKRRFGLVLYPPPIALPPITIDLIWHERRHRDPLLTWVRSQFEAGTS